MEVEDLDFGDLAYFEGEEFDIANEFDTGSTSLSGIRGKAKVLTTRLGRHSYFWGQITRS